MSCGEPHETDCSEVLDHLYEYLDREMPEGDCAKFKEHFDECSPCFEKYGLEREVKKLVKRCCGQDDVPSDLRAKVMGRIEVIRQGETPASADAVQAEDTRSAAGTGTVDAAMETVDAAGSEDDKNPA
ncbi:mycothiol system anti-sigma-R factor [Streptomyces sp. CA-250714]|uniref:mycothiol system anti-sigma-R factor n=1 Tax=Streptomyces sp. CA-250714 TaxID=3240060 RepID=UPI003D937CCD